MESYVLRRYLPKKASSEPAVESLRISFIVELPLIHRYFLFGVASFRVSLESS